MLSHLRGCPLLLFTCGLLASLAHAQFTYNVVYNFGSNVGDPIQPYSSGIIAQGRDGNMYSSTCEFDNSSNSGATGTYKMSPAGGQPETYGYFATDGNCPFGGLTLGTDGNFYGTNYGGGFSSVP